MEMTDELWNMQTTTSQKFQNEQLVFSAKGYMYMY